MAVFRYPLKPIEDSPYLDLVKALGEHPRRIPSKYFYDDEGSRIFQRITDLNEYYPTACENEILEKQSADILTACGFPARLNIVELGAGDGRKTTHLLKAAQTAGMEIVYRPVDISPQALKTVQTRLSHELPKLEIAPCELDMELDFRKLPIRPHERNMILYLGSSLGNFSPTEQISFLTKIKMHMHDHDLLLLGLDLKKESSILQKAYDDSKGLTRSFNMNLLTRLNRELNADFNPKRFKHLASYNPATGSMESWLISQEEQTVMIHDLSLTLHLDAFEGIHTETSWKFSPREIRTLARVTKLNRVASFFDHRGWYTDELWSYY